jgi:hypothetical protein
MYPKPVFFQASFLVSMILCASVALAEPEKKTLGDKDCNLEGMKLITAAIGNYSTLYKNLYGIVVALSGQERSQQYLLALEYRQVEAAIQGLQPEKLSC